MTTWICLLVYGLSVMSPVGPGEVEGRPIKIPVTHPLMEIKDGAEYTISMKEFLHLSTTDCGVGRYWEVSKPELVGLEFFCEHGNPNISNPKQQVIVLEPTKTGTFPVKCKLPRYKKEATMMVTVTE